MFEEEELVRGHQKRANDIIKFILIAFGVILSRLWYLQIYKGDQLYEYSLQNRLRKEIVRAPRGMVYSRDGQLLVDNVPRFDAVLTPQYLKDREITFNRLGKILDMSVEKIEKILQKNSTMARYRHVVIKKNITLKEVAMIETENATLPGISVETFISREYKDVEAGAHVLGYISEINKDQLPKYRERSSNEYVLGDFIGQFGLEEMLDEELRGTNGYEYVEVDAFGRKKKHIANMDLFEGIDNLPTVPGHNVRLTIDRDLQIAAYRALNDFDKVGAAVALDVNTGEILAYVSTPSFDPGQFSRGITSEYWKELTTNENNPLRDRNIQEHYSPGSTFKAITAIALLEEGIINKNTEIICGGTLQLGAKTYHCWKEHGHGRVDVYRALRESCNIFFQKASLKLDIDRLAYYANLLGLGTKTGIELPREISGLIPTKEWKFKRNGIEWQLGETLSCAIGQSYVLTTPLQLAISYMAMANGGKLWRPYLVKEIFNNNGEVIRKISPELLREQKLHPEVLEVVREGLYQVVNSPGGTGYWFRGRGLQLAGKTGTSQVIGAVSKEKLFEKCEKKEMRFRHHGLFVGYAPKDSPKIAIAAIVEHGCHGNTAAMPVVTAITSTYMKKYYPELQKELEQDEARRGVLPPIRTYTQETNTTEAEEVFVDE